MTADLEAIKDPKLLRHAIQHHSIATEQRGNSLDKKLPLLKLTSGRGIFSVSIPACVTAAWGLGVTNPFALLAVGSLVVGSMLVSSRLERYLAKADSTLAYIHSLRKNWSPKTYAKGFIELNLAGHSVHNRLSIRERLQG